MTRDQARKRFNQLGVSKKDLTNGDYYFLIAFLAREIEECEATKKRNMIITFIWLPAVHKTIFSVNVGCDDFDSKEGIAFRGNGIISFADWANDEELQPFLRAFDKWCDWLEENK